MDGMRGWGQKNSSPHPLEGKKNLDELIEEDGIYFYLQGLLKEKWADTRQDSLPGVGLGPCTHNQHQIIIDFGMNIHIFNRLLRYIIFIKLIFNKRFQISCLSLSCNIPQKTKLPTNLMISQDCHTIGSSIV